MRGTAQVPEQEANWIERLVLQYLDQTENQHVFSPQGLFDNPSGAARRLLELLRSAEGAQTPELPSLEQDPVAVALGFVEAVPETGVHSELVGDEQAIPPGHQSLRLRDERHGRTTSSQSEIIS
jgi:hypothetical protein